MTTKDVRKAVIDAAMTMAGAAADGTLDVASLDALAAAECRELFGTVAGPEDPLWELHVSIGRQLLAVGGWITADELAEWVAVYRAAEGAEVVPVRELSWIEQALADEGECGAEELTQIGPWTR